MRFPKPRCPVTGKRAFVDEDSANAALRLAWEVTDWDNRHDRMPKRVYECPECGWWHLSSSSRSRQAATS